MLVSRLYRLNKGFEETCSYDSTHECTNRYDTKSHWTSLWFIQVATEETAVSTVDLSLILRIIVVNIFENHSNHVVKVLGVTFVYWVSCALVHVQTKFQGCHQLHRWSNNQGT